MPYGRGVSGGASRGPYAKGVARRREILHAALDAYAASDRNGPRLRDIAAAVGLTEAGVLHYFASKDDLFVEILRARDEDALRRFDLTTAAEMTAYLRETTETVGLTKLFVDMSAAAADPAHPAHAFFEEHTAGVVRLFSRAFPRVPRDRLPLLAAAAEGLQLMWLRDPDVDVAESLLTLVATLGDGTASTS